MWLRARYSNRVRSACRRGASSRPGRSNTKDTSPVHASFSAGVSHSSVGGDDGAVKSRSPCASAVSPAMRALYRLLDHFTREVIRCSVHFMHEVNERTEMSKVEFFATPGYGDRQLRNM